ncbi:CRISPR-associated endonuclease Cas2 [Schleiferilactobacillus harbinensis]|uniref:CRISPR-associated endonuclease Cas2 n=1 Tax=Schleiferilactobacillus harbinensis TaxID=304207 RepID=UPI0012393707|nr:CRISPR-associated endonuclease Cas2 [Schleiferilactobacillus harbinensis]QEU47552.1 CRISPR-associated endonuclease Cas2 [Schleiferilactobacillus harbinensis]
MRLIVMFDLPTITSADRRAYRHFKKALDRECFLMLQESVYMRVCPNNKSADFLIARLKNISPEDGLIQAMMVTEKQYQAMIFISGTASHDLRNSAARTVIL